MEKPHRWLGILLALVVSSTAYAGDGAITWKTLHADGIELTFPRTHEALARRVLATWQDARQTLGAVLPPPTGVLQLTLDDFADTSNGFASVLPFDHVHLYAYPPGPSSELGDHGDWLRALVFHEYAHILHLGDVHGVPTWINAVLGRTLMPNAGLPRFFTEGLATWAETRLTGGDHAVAGHGGRMGSPAFMAILRATVLDGGQPELSELTGTLQRWPRGQGWYLYGSMLVDDLAQTHGQQSIRAFIDGIARRIFGIGIQGTARYTWGKSLTRAWHDAQARLDAQVREKWREREGAELPIDPTALAEYLQRHDGDQVTHDGEHRGRIRSWPDGQSAVVSHLASDAQLYRIERVYPDHVTTLHTCRADCDEALVTPDAKWLLYTETRRYQRVYSFRELIAVPLDASGRVAGDELQLTQRARLRSTSLSLDGKQLAAVRIDRGRTQIDVLSLPDALTAAQAGEDPPSWQRRVAPSPFGQTLDSPVLLRDGHLIWTAWKGGHRGLESEVQPAAATCLALEVTPSTQRVAIPEHVSPQLLDPVQSILAQMCPHLAQRQPIWLGDLQLRVGGDGLVHLSGVVEIDHFREAAVLTRWGWLAKTRTLTGVTSFAVGGEPFTVRHGGRGLDVFHLRKPFWFAGNTPQLDYVDEPYHPTHTDAEEVAYNPLRSAWPRAWRPLLTATGDRASTAPGGVWLGAQVAGEDALSHWNWLATGQIRDDGTDPIGSLSIGITRWEPTWTLDTGYQQGFSWLRRGFSWATTPTDRWGIGARGSWQLPQVRDTWKFDLGWRMVKSSLRDDRYAVRYPYDPAGPPPVEPWTGVDSFVDAGVSWTYGTASPDAFTTERLHSFALRGSVSDSWTGGARRRVILTALAANRVPLGRHFVAELTSNLAFIPESGDTSPSYVVRGIQPLPTNVLAGSGASSITVRGMPVDSIFRAGDGMAWGTAQLHIPLATLGRGFDTLPLWFGRLRATPFVDAAWAFLPPPKAERFTGGTWSTGAELLLNWELGYGLPGTLRLGAGHEFLTQSTAWWLVLGI